MSELELACGPQGLKLRVPEGVRMDVPRPVQPLPPERPQAAAQLEAAFRAAGQDFSKFAEGKRRAALLVGDLGLPAPYHPLLGEICRAVVAQGVRPSRVALFSWPGLGGPVRGRAAIRRLGEAAVGDFELRAWEPEGEPDALYATADLRIAVFAPGLPRPAFPEPAPTHVLSLVPGKGIWGALERIDLTPVAEAAPAVAPKGLPGTSGAPVVLVTGGGAPFDATFEEALLGLRYLPAASAERTLVLAFGGDEGAGSSHFMQDLAALLKQAAEVLEAGSPLPPPEGPLCEPFDAAAWLATALCAWKQVLLYAPEFAAHEDSDELQEQLEAHPKLAGKLDLLTDEAELWARLTRDHGASFELFAEPLGWRAG
jgi:hypothetical protein